MITTFNSTSEIPVAGQHGEYLRIMMVAMEATSANTTKPQSNFTAAIPWGRVSADNVAYMSGWILLHTPS